MDHTVLGFDVTRELSRTQRAMVYRARARGAAESVVMKVLRERDAPPDRVASFRREYDLLRRLSGVEGVPAALAYGRHDGHWAIVMDDLGGASLDGITRERSLGLGDVITVVAGVAEILARVHQRGLVHRDISPSNVVFNRETGTVRIIDFGAASQLDHLDESFETPTAHEGTLAYMSPEQTGRMNRVVDSRSDLYGLGATLYQLLVGAPPFSTLDPMELVHAHLAWLPVPPCARNEAVPRALSDIAVKLLAKDADARYPSATSLHTDLVECARQLRETGEISLFELALDRRPVRFALPQRLYGREPEVRAIVDAVERAARGAQELLLLSGYSGVGKTALVHETFTPLTAHRGFFIDGKFDQLRRDTPYAPLVEAFRSLTRQLLGESEAHLVMWRDRLRDALGPNGQVMVDVIPELGLVMGPQAAVATLAAAEAAGRFEHVAGLFISAFTRAEHPLAIFLDDLQWADPSSLRFLENVLLRGDGHHLLVIGAYRDNEVSAGHPLLLALDRLRARESAITDIALRPLDPAAVAQFVADALGATVERAAPLAEVAHAKTRGNPFFLRAFLTSLHREGLLRAAETWTWDLDAIRARDITDNVVTLMSARLGALPAATCSLLQTAGALGGRFDLRTLSVACALPAATVWKRLWPAVSEGLVLPLDAAWQLLATEGGDDSPEDLALADSVTVRCRFAHDRIHEAAYARIDPGERAATHWQIGARMRAVWGDAPKGERLFEIVGHMNAGRACATDADTRDALAALNLAAARRAKASAAFTAAHEHASVGLELLGPDRYTRRYELAMDLVADAAETAFQTGDHARMESLFAEGIGHARRPLDAAWLHEIRTEALNAQGRPLEALSHALDYLDALGVHCPRAPSYDDVVARMGATEASLVGRSVDDLAAMPDIADPAIRTAVSLICKVYSSAYVASPLVFATVTLLQMQLVVAHGNSPVSSLVYAVYGLLLAGLAGNVERGYALGRLSDRLLDRPDVSRYRAQALHLFNCHTRFWREHVRCSADGERMAWRVGLETGEVEFGSYGGHVASKYAFFHGQELVGLVAEMEHYTRAMRRRRSDIALHSHLPWHQAAVNLATGCESPWALRGPLCDEEAMRPVLAMTNDRMSRSNTLTARLILCVLFERFAEAAALAREGAALLDSVLSQFNQPVHHFFSALATLAVCGVGAGEGRDAAIAEVEASLSLLRRWSSAAPVNFAQKVSLIEAELLRVRGDVREARDRYDEAITLAQRHEFGLDEAVACECAARFMLSQQRPLAARHYLRDARDAYARWGARSKVAALESLHPEALSAVERSRTDVTRSARTTRALTEGFDATSVIRASQALSREVRLPDLLRALAAAVMENAGAERAVLLLEHDQQLMIEADTRVGSAPDEVLRAVPMGAEGPALLAESVVKYALRSREAVVLDDARSARIFASDPYIRAHSPRSVLCQPIIGQGQVKGAIYLENNLMTGAFTSMRCDVVGLLAGQMAIAVDNARHYATLEARVRERTAQLEARNRFIRQLFGRYLSDDVVDSLLASAQGVEIGGARRTVTVMFTDLRGFTAICEDFAPERVTALLNHYLGEMTRLVHRHHGIIDDIIGDGMLVIFGAPAYLDDHAAHAVACALEMQRAMASVNAWNQQQALPPVAMGIGIHTGDVVVGSIGSEQRAKYGAVGRNVNLGARIESVTAAGQVLISEATRRAVPHPLRINGERSFTPKGMTEPLTVYDVGAIGGPFDVTLPERASLCVLREPLCIGLSVISGKEVRPERVEAWLHAASDDAAEIRSAVQLPEAASARLEIPRDDGSIELVYGRVASSQGDRFTVRLDQISARLSELVAAECSALRDLP